MIFCNIMQAVQPITGGPVLIKPGFGFIGTGNLSIKWLTMREQMS